MAEPLVSILIPAFDAAATLPTCLASLTRQGHEGWECVIIDDGSHDQTLAVAEAFAHRDPRFRVLACAHRGIVSALNEGLSACRAPWIARMDADDWMHRDRLSCQLRAVSDQPALAAVGCHVRMFPRAGLSDGRRAYENWLNSIRTPAQVRVERFVECPIAHPSLFARRETLATLGWRDAGWPEDYDLVLRILERDEVGIVARRLLAWRDTPTRLSRTSPAYAQERFTACKAAFLAQGFLRDDDEYVLWGFGSTGKALRRALGIHAKQPSHIVELHPRRLGQRIHGAPVVPPEALASLPRRPVVASVAGAEARHRIRRALDAMGFRESRDYVCAA